MASRVMRNGIRTVSISQYSSIRGVTKNMSIISQRP